LAFCSVINNNFSEIKAFPNKKVTIETKSLKKINIQSNQFMKMRIVTCSQGKCDYFVQPTVTDLTAGYTIKGKPTYAEKMSIFGYKVRCNKI